MDRTNVLTGAQASWQDTTEGVDDREHLLEVLQRAQQALDALWRLAEPSLSRNATRNLFGTISWSYWQVCDALTHSVGWLQAMPQRASDGTSVWHEEPPAVTNEVRPHDEVARRETNADGVSGGRQERNQLPDRAGAGEPFDEVRALRYQLRVEKQKASKRSFPPRRTRRKKGRR